MIEDNRIPEIRAVLDETRVIGATAHREVGNLRAKLDRIRAILDSAPPVPRVFFPGDTVPAGVAVMLDDWSLLEAIPVAELQSEQDGTVVELLGIPTSEEWQAAVDRARAARDDL